MSTKQKSLIIFSICVILIPFLGLPYAWKHWLFVIVGVLLLGISLRLPRFTSREKERLNTAHEASSSEDERALMHDHVVDGDEDEHSL